MRCGPRRYTFILIFGCQGCVNTFLDVARARGALDRIRALIASGAGPLRYFLLR